MASPRWKIWAASRSSMGRTLTFSGKARSGGGEVLIVVPELVIFLGGGWGAGEEQGGWERACRVGGEGRRVSILVVEGGEKTFPPC